MEWFALLPALAVAAALLIVPGLAIAFVIRLRGLAAWAVAFPISVTAIAVASVWAQLVGMRWSWIPVALTAAVAAVVCVGIQFAFRRLFAGGGDQPILRRGVLVGSLVLAGVMIATQVILVIGEPRNISQTFDNVFHLNAVRYVLDTGSASPLTLGGMTSAAGGIPFYPSAWHGLVALVVDATGAGIPAASNAVVLVVAALAWPASVMLLTTTVVRTRPAVVFSAGVLSAGCVAFPLLMLDYGVLYPYFLAVAVLPAVIAMTIRLLGLGTCRPEPTITIVLSGLAMLPGLVLAHPGGFVAWLFAASLCAVWAWIRLLRTKPGRRPAVLWTVLLAGFAVVAFVAWRAMRPPLEARLWPTNRTIPQALGEVLFQGTYGSMLSPLLAVTFIVGLVVVWRSRELPGRVAIALFLVYAALYVASSASPWGNFRDLLTAAWYNNAPRLAALLPMLVVPLAAVGAAWILARIQRAVAEAPKVAIPASAVTAAGAVVLVAGSQFGAVPEEIRLASWVYQTSDGSPLLSSDEYELLERLPEEVPKDAVIAGSPWTGTALAYAISDRDVVMRHMLTDLSPEGNEVINELDDPTDEAALCEALERTGVRYALDFGPQEVHGATHTFTGLDDLGLSDNVRLIDREGSARLFEITACGLAK